MANLEVKSAREARPYELFVDKNTGEAKYIDKKRNAQSLGGGGGAAEVAKGIAYINNKLTGEITYFDTLWDACDAAQEGDTVTVLPNHFIFDNTERALDDTGFDFKKFNLWKNNVTWHFQDVTIELTNYSSDWGGTGIGGGSDIELFRPYGGAHPRAVAGVTKCTVTGNLKYIANGVPGNPNSDGGQMRFVNFNAEGGDNNGSIFHYEVESLFSSQSCAVEIQTSATAGYVEHIGRVKKDIEYSYVGGNGYSGAMIMIFTNGTAGRFELTYGSFKNTYAYNFYLRGDFSNYVPVIIEGERLTETRPDTQGCIFYDRGAQNMVLHASSALYGGGNTAGGLQGAVYNTDPGGPSLGNDIAITGDYRDTVENANTRFLFYTYNATNKLRYKGDIYLRHSSDVGKGIAYKTNFDMVGNIYFEGAVTNKRALLVSEPPYTINFTGRLRGNYAGLFMQMLGGIVRLNNADIYTDVDDVAATAFVNNSTTVGKLIISDSRINMSNSTNPIAKLDDANVFISNSSITNKTGKVVSGTKATAVLQIHNSTVIGVGQTVEVSLGTVTTVSSASNLAPAVTGTLNGTFTVLAALAQE